jgi:type IV pilus assembly protein PilM
MVLPFLSSGPKKKDHVVAIDLGTRVTKAVLVNRRGDSFSLSNFVVKDAPVYDRTLSADKLTDHLKSVMHDLGAKGKQVTLVIGPGDSVLRTAELPSIPARQLLQLLKVNSKTYLQQELKQYLFDCHILGPVAESGEGEGAQKGGKSRALVGGAKQEYVENLKLAAKQAGLVVDIITTSLVQPANAFEQAMPDVFEKEVVALVDFGYKNSFISILMMGELSLSRAVGFGAAKLTTGIAESLGVSQAEAEGIKVGMPQEVEETIQPLLTPLGRELRASIDFFEHQQDKTVSQVFFSGGSSISDHIIQALQSELMVPCKSWNPAGALTMDLPPQRIGEVEQIAPQLTVAVGAAAMSF